MCIASILSTIYPEPSPDQIFNICLNFSYDVPKSNLWFVTITASELIYIVSTSYLLITLFHLFKVIVADKTYLKPLFPSNKSENRSIVLLFAKNNDSDKLFVSVTSTL